MKSGKLLFMKGRCNRFLGVFFFLSTFSWGSTSYGLLQHPSLSGVAEKAVKSVVNISSVRVVRYRQSPLFEDPFFQYFFGKNGISPFGVPRERRQRSLGSGVIVSRDGYVLTNNHVVENASEVSVLLSDQVEVKAKIIGTDPPTDLALLKIPLPKKHKPLPMGDSNTLRLAESVLAIGSPFGFGGTVTQGIVSAKGRANIGIADYEDFIQTDAAINPGNSGGALVNTKGQLVGINTAIYSRSGGYQGIGFAIPINMASSVMKRLIEDGKVERGWLGMTYQDVTPDIARSFGLKQARGVIVNAIFRDGSADQAGLKPGDLIRQFNGVDVRHSGHFDKLLSDIPNGKMVQLNIRRERQALTLKAKVEPLPEHSRDLRHRRR